MPDTADPPGLSRFRLGRGRPAGERLLGFLKPGARYGDDCLQVSVRGLYLAERPVCLRTHSKSGLELRERQYCLAKGCDRPLHVPGLELLNSRGELSGGGLDHSHALSVSSCRPEAGPRSGGEGA